MSSAPDKVNPITEMSMSSAANWLSCNRWKSSCGSLSYTSKRLPGALSFLKLLLPSFIASSVAALFPAILMNSTSRTKRPEYVLLLRTVSVTPAPFSMTSLTPLRFATDSLCA